jgi:hypothetical protein
MKVILREAESQSRSLMGLVAASCLGAMLFFTGAPCALASVTLGQVAPTTPAANCGGPGDFAQPTVTSGPSYVAPGAGTITSWSHQAASGAGQQLALKVFRKVADPATYRVIGHDGPHDLAPNGLNGFPANLQVKAGDVLGLGNPTSTLFGCKFTSPGESFLVAAGYLQDGGFGAFSTDTSGNPRLNVSAVFVYSNSFAFGKKNLNKKKGTATLTVSVPNPGELTMSTSPTGAGLTKSVATAGDVQLLVKATGKQKKQLKQSGKVTVKPTIAFTPTGGETNTQSTRLKLKKR